MQNKIISFCNDLLSIDTFKDYAPNGLQVESTKKEIKKIALGVSASYAMIQQAIEWNADLILVHHGLFWKGQSYCLTGNIYKKISLLLQHNIALGAYHLPLDFHQTIGNHIQLAKQLEWKAIRFFPIDGIPTAGLLVQPNVTAKEELSSHIETKLQRKPIILGNTNTSSLQVAIITGGAQKYFTQALQANANGFLTGEVSEQHYDLANEEQAYFISAGHYATEMYGIQALGKVISTEFQIETQFFSFPNPI